MISRKRFSLVLVIIVPLSIGFGILISQFWDTKQISTTANQPRRPIEKIKSEAFNGSPDAYRELRTIYWDYSQEEFLFWAIYAGNKFRNKGAFTDAYRIIEQSYYGNSDSFTVKGMDTLTQKLIMQYLVLAADSGDLDAKNHLFKINKTE